MQLFQLLGSDNNEVGLYATERAYTIQEAQKIFDDGLALAKAKENKQLEEFLIMEEECDVQEEAGEFLKFHGIIRVFTENITTEIL